MSSLKSVFFKVVITVTLISLNGCLVTRDEMNDREISKQTQAQVTQMQKVKADQENKIFVLQDELRQLNGRLDAMERKYQEESQKQNQGPSNKDIIDQMKIFEQNLQQMKAHIDELETKLTQAQAQAQAQVQAATAKPALIGEAATKSKGKPRIQETWNTAEELFAKKEWKQAVLAYQSYRDASPKGANYPVATYKIGICFQELNMPDEAKAFFQEVIQKFPNNPMVKKAKYRLSRMK